MDLSLIIINWNSVDYLRNCIKSIIQNCHGLKYEIIVVDNASYDGSDQMIKTEFPDTIFIQSNENIGFARANNLGYKKCSGNVLFFLNPDTEIINDAILQMYKFIISNKNAGIVGCKLLNTDGSVQTNCLLPFPTLFNEIFDIEYLKMTLKFINIWGIKPLLYKNKNPVRVDIINGASIMIKRNVFEIVGLFTTDYFMYSEDVDLGYKIKQAGFNSYYIPSASIMHHGGKSTLTKKNTHFMAVLMRESRFLFFKRTKSIYYAYMYRFLIFIVSIIRLSILIMGIFLTIRSEKNKDIRISFLKWKHIFNWTIGREKWTKKAGFIK